MIVARLNAGCLRAVFFIRAPGRACTQPRSNVRWIFAAGSAPLRFFLLPKRMAVEKNQALRVPGAKTLFRFLFKFSGSGAKLLVCIIRLTPQYSQSF